MVLAGAFLFIMNYYNYRMLSKEEKAKKTLDSEKRSEEHIRTETKDGKALNTENIQGSPETVPLRGEEEGGQLKMKNSSTEA